METNRRGRCFISYRRCPQRIKDAVRLRDALCDRGLPTWRDLDDLGPEPTEAELRRTLRDENTNMAVMLVSPSVEDSPIIREVEAPEIFRRHRNHDGFVVQVVLIDLDYADVERVLGRPAGFQSLEGWNLLKLPSKTLPETKAREVAVRLLRRRLERLFPRGEDKTISVGLFARRQPGNEDFDLRHDFSRYFDNHLATPRSYKKMELALRDAASAILRTRNQPRIVGQGTATLPLGLLFGALFSPLAQFSITWRQPLAGHPTGNWGLDGEGEAYDALVEQTYGDPSSEGIVLAISVSANIMTSVVHFLAKEGRTYRAAVHVRPQQGALKQGQALQSGQGLTLVRKAIDGIRSAREELELSDPSLHIFMACPLAMAVLVGQSLNTFGNVFLYEHTAGGELPYQFVHRFNPSDIEY